MVKHFDHPKQCGNCPWKKSTKLEDIDCKEGFDMDYYESVRDDYVACHDFDRSHKNMGCHKFPNDSQPCIGWLLHEAGPGNNIGIRLMLSCVDNANELETFGPQHKSIKDFFKTEEELALDAEEEDWW